MAETGGRADLSVARGTPISFILLIDSLHFPRQQIFINIKIFF
jgi:hypothetical protein